MSKRVQIHARTYERARRLGAEMAADPNIKPHLESVAQYSGYYRFRLAHRAHLEQSSRFERYYQERIFALADHEAKYYEACHMDSMSSWDLWYHHVVHPIKCIVWQSWEEANRLEARYLDALLTSGAATPADFHRLLSPEDAEPADNPQVVVTANKGLLSRIRSIFTRAHRPAKPKVQESKAPAALVPASV